MKAKYTPGPIRVEEESNNTSKWLVLRVADPAFDSGKRDLCEPETIAVNVARSGLTPQWEHTDDAEEIIANATLWAAAPEMAEALTRFVDHTYCPNCGCDLWNTKGCTICPVMREAYNLLVKLGLREPRQFAEFLDADPINKRNMKAGLL